MKISGTIRILVILLSASLLAACGQAATPSANQDVPPVSAPVSAPTLAPSGGPTAALPTAAPLATASAKPSATSPSAAAGDLCSLLTKDEVGKVFGQVVLEVTPKDPRSDCLYKSKDLTFEVTVFRTGGAKYIKDTKTKLGALALDLPGVGDGSFYNTNSFINTLFLGKGDAAYLIDVKKVASSPEITPEDVRAKEKALALQLLSKLK
jgi:hypothetical protein